MRQLHVTLTDEQYEYVKAQGRLWLRDVVQIIMDHGPIVEIPSTQTWTASKNPWWKLW